MSKQVAKSIKHILDDETIQLIRDRSYQIDELIPEVLEYNTPDLYKRAPSPADKDTGITSLDMSTFLSALAERKAIIKLPEYKSGSASVTRRKDEHVLDPENRKGQIIGLVSNVDFFNFSISIKDHNVMRSNEKGEKLGVPRTFTVFRFGEWYEGWKEIEFIPNVKENDFITNFQLSDKGKITFDLFVNPEKRFNIFSKNYFLLKTLILRVVEESNYYKTLAGKLPKPKGTGKAAPSLYDKHDYVATGKKLISVKKPAMNVEVDIPNFIGSYSKEKDFNKVKERHRHLQFDVLPVLRYHARCLEFAYWKFGQGRLPPWIKNAKIQEEKQARTLWQRVIYGQSAVGERGHGVRYRVFEKSVQIEWD